MERHESGGGGIKLEGNGLETLPLPPVEREGGERKKKK
jgi:hypothetical protein